MSVGWCPWRMRAIITTVKRWALPGLICAWLGACVEPAAPEPSHFGFPDSFSASKAGLELVPAFPAIDVVNPTSMIEAAGRFFVAQQNGRVHSFEPDGTGQTLVLDLSSRTQWGNDAGLLAIAAHPDFGAPSSSKRGYLYAYYAYSEDPIAPDDLVPATETRARLSRFTLDDDTHVVDPDSELVLIDLRDRHVWHQGGGMFFHPDDGFLYLAIGDEGGVRCRFDNCQRLDKSLYGGVLRIDVDRRGGEVSHPIVRAPEEGHTAHYFIPNDNPFLDEPNVLEEFYAVGLRNPHRMTHDPVGGHVFIGDVGHKLEEEIDVLAPGANFQWDLFEGTSPIAQPGEPELSRPVIPEHPGVWTDPALAYPREQLAVLIGGYVYRGDKLPALYGKYLHADHAAGSILTATPHVEDGLVAMDDSEVVLESRFAGRSDGITSFARGADGQIYVLVLGSGPRILAIDAARRLEARVPERLSKTGLFEDLETLRPAPGLVEYQVRVPLWSDGADKRRFIAVPDGEERVGFARDGAYRFPPGTLFVKHFERALDARHPERRRRLETRVLMLTKNGVYGLTYKWNASQSDAELLRDHVEEELEIVDEEGVTKRAVYVYPSPGECLRCHDPDGAMVLGFKTSQLNLEHDGRAQLAALAERDLFASPPREGELAELPALAALDDESESVETRVRSYLDANCAHCHSDRPLGEARWDARFETPLNAQGIIDAPLHGRDAEPDSRVIAPRDLARSVLYQRIASADPAERMPPLASRLVDQDFVALLERWIAEL